MFSVMLVLFMNNVMFLCHIILSFKEHVSCEVKILKQSLKPLNICIVFNITQTLWVFLN